MYERTIIVPQPGAMQAERAALQTHADLSEVDGKPFVTLFGEPTCNDRPAAITDDEGSSDVPLDLAELSAIIDKLGVDIHRAIEARRASSTYLAGTSYT